MWETKILGVDLYHVLAWFWLYSFCGWIWESSYVSIRQKKLVNRGFVNGPLLTLYGTGAVMGVPGHDQRDGILDPAPV